MTTASALIVFAGPSIGREQIVAIIPSADVRRPIRRGNLEEVPDGALVAIIDGVFDAELAVSPREIRRALGRRVRIIGSSSMGALRAVEVPEMLGVGRIYQSYRDGTTTRDDEVAILLDNDTGRALTEPLVNIRFAVSRLVSAGTLAAAIGERIVETAAAMHFHDRTYRNILRTAGLADSADADKLLSALKSIDLKREDAVTLLEQIEILGADPHWQRLADAGFRAVDGERAYYSDRLDELKIEAEVPADAPVMVWEYGEAIDFRRLLRFLVATGRFDGHARNALLRYVLDGGNLDDPVDAPKSSVTTAQDLMDATATDWGWETPEEVHVTLRDLGVGLGDLETRYKEEYEARRRLLLLYESMPDELLRALRFELLTNDLALKREAMRVGALEALAAEAPEAPTAEELAEARSALAAVAFERVPMTRWEQLLGNVGHSSADIEDIVALVACARRTGVPLCEAMENGGAVPTSLPGVDVLPEARFVQPGRSRTDADALAIAQRISDHIGITRVAQIGELGRIGGLHVASSYRPSIWSATVGAGKSESREGAFVGAIMEEFEKWCQEKFVPDIVDQRSFDDLTTSGAIDPRSLSLPFDSTYSPSRPLDWTWAMDLVSGEKVLVPAAALTRERVPNDIFFSPRLARKMFTTNGLASSLSLTEAISHALAERIERHAVKLAEQDTGNPGRMPPGAPGSYSFVDIATCPPSTRSLCEKLKADGEYTVRVMDITSDIRVPTFTAELSLPRGSRFEIDRIAQGMCTHPNAEIAINRAILEAVQCVLTGLSGAREDMTLNVQSLGRHERPRAASLDTALWVRPWLRKKPFAANAGVINNSARDDVRMMVAALVAASYPRVLYRDYSVESTQPGAGVRVLLPGSEDVNPLHTGRRARACAVRDLLHRHEPL